MPITDPKDSDQNADAETTSAPTPEVQNVFIMIVTVGDDHRLYLFFDAAGLLPMDNTTPMYVLGDRTGHREGRVRFNFIASAIPGSHGDVIETADLIIIGQTVEDPARERGQRKDSPFLPPRRPVYFIDDPAPDSDPGNLHGSLPGTNGYISAQTQLRIRLDGENGPAYKYSIIALCDGRTQIAVFDPIVIIKPN